MNGTTASYKQGELVATARMYLAVYNTQVLNPRSVVLDQLLAVHERELLRLLNNTLQIHANWGSVQQLCCLIIFMHDGYVPVQSA